jgi:DDE_Tnp_1-associated
VTSSPVPGVRVEPAVLRAATIVQLMTQVPDPRHRRGRRHPLTTVLVIAVGAVTAGARSLTGIGEWAHDVGADLLDLVGLTGSVPSEATIRRVIEALDATMFSLLCGAWTRLRWKQVDGQGVLAIDGKTVRRATTRGARAPHLVAALTHDTGLVIGQGRG